MNASKKYDIAFKGLSVGNHLFSFNVGKDFFDSFEDSEVIDGELSVNVRFMKGRDFLDLAFQINGDVIVPCDRCLEDCRIPIESDNDLKVELTSEEIEDGEEYDGEVLRLNVEQGVINIAHYIYESIILALPYQRIHDMDENGNTECNLEMLEKFKIVSKEEFDNLTELVTHQIKDSPQADALRELKEKMNEQEQETERGKDK